MKRTALSKRSGLFFVGGADVCAEMRAYGDSHMQRAANEIGGLQKWGAALRHLVWQD